MSSQQDRSPNNNDTTTQSNNTNTITNLLRLPTQKAKDQSRRHPSPSINNTANNIILSAQPLIRTDIQGNIIKKGGKRKTYHISFRDELIKDNGKTKKLVSVINIESYKEYNKTMSYQGKEGREYERNASGNCCISGCLIL